MLIAYCRDSEKDRDYYENQDVGGQMILRRFFWGQDSFSKRSWLYGSSFTLKQISWFLSLMNKLPVCPVSMQYLFMPNLKYLILYIVASCLFNDKWKALGRTRQPPNLRYHLLIFLEGLRKPQELQPISSPNFKDWILNKYRMAVAAT